MKKRKSCFIWLLCILLLVTALPAVDFTEDVYKRQAKNTSGKPLTFGKEFTPTGTTTDSKGYYITTGTVVYLSLIHI